MLASEEEVNAKHNVQGGGERRKEVQCGQHVQPQQEGNTEKGPSEVHVHVECKHGFALVSGMRDDTLQPACYEEKCKEDGERWLRSEGLVGQLHEKPRTVQLQHKAEEGTSKEAADKKAVAPTRTAAWAPPAGVPSLRGENREEFLQSCDGWYRSDKG